MPQSTRISTKARDEAELLAILANRIHEDGMVTPGELAAFRHQIEVVQTLIAEVDDTNALTVAILRGGVFAPRVGELSRDMERTHGKVVHLPFPTRQRRRESSTPPDAA